jgi:hypothetical protein
MTRTWSKKTWFFVILAMCLVILLFAGSTGAADAIRTILHGLIGLFGAIAHDLVGLAGQLVDKLGK